MITKNQIVLLADKYFHEIVTIRRQIHMNPELSYHEKQTAKLIASILKKLAIPFNENITGFGITALIKGKQKNNKSKLVALRADMDALPIDEKNTTNYISKNTGIMHACGHDAHTASLLGVAHILKSLENEFSGTVMLIFQPAEEKVPGGAKAMIESGIFKNNKPNYIIAQHVETALNAGTVGLKSGIYMASTDELFLKVTGKGGHGAMPHLNKDTILIASNIIIALQQVVSRMANPAIPTVLSFGKIIGNGATNIIPDIVDIEGTFRTTDEIWRKTALKNIEKIASDIAKSMGGKCITKINHGYPVLVNDANTTMQAKKFAVEYLGKKNVFDLELKMTAEDFAYFAQQAPSVFYRLGVKNEKHALSNIEGKKIASSIHTSTFDIDESALKTGMGLMAWMAVEFLNEK